MIELERIRARKGVRMKKKGKKITPQKFNFSKEFVGVWPVFGFKTEPNISRKQGLTEII